MESEVYYIITLRTFPFRCIFYFCFLTIQPAVPFNQYILFFPLALESINTNENSVIYIIFLLNLFMCQGSVLCDKYHLPPSKDDRTETYKGEVSHFVLSDSAWKWQCELQRQFVADWTVLHCTSFVAVFTIYC